MSEPERDPQRRQLRVGRLVKAHGLKGGLKLELYTDNPQARFVPGAQFTLQVPEGSRWHGKTVTVREYRVMNGHSVLFLEDVPDRTEAEGIARAILWWDQTEDVAEEDAWYDHQLVGLDVVRDGSVIGKVARIEHLPAQDLVIVRTSGADSREVMVPLVSVFVPEVDLAQGRVVITPPLGLFEDLSTDADDSDQSSPAVEESAAPVETDSAIEGFSQP